MILWLCCFLIFSTAQGEELNTKINIGGRLYSISAPGILLSAPKAARECNLAGMTLIGLETQLEYLQVTDYLLSNGLTDSYWSSGHDYSDTHIWTSSGTLMSSDQWSLGEPDQSGYRDLCVWISAAHGLADDPCPLPLPYICEQR